LDGSKKIEFKKINDNFCDCPDGSDEVGTAACSHLPKTRFYCQNKGFIPSELYSSRVNDGICDCCDGADENDGTVVCQNTCQEKGKSIKEEIERKIQQYQKGLEIKKKNSEKAKPELEALKLEYKEKENQLNEKKLILTKNEGKLLFLFSKILKIIWKN
jgi:protein kinase C substrate 80K-H